MTNVPSHLVWQIERCRREIVATEKREAKRRQEEKQSSEKEEMEYKHHWEIPENAWYLKFYCWLWEGDPERADFCKLFWGYLFTIIPVGPILHLLFFIFKSVEGVGQEKRQERKRRRVKEQEEIRAKKLKEAHDLAKVDTQIEKGEPSPPVVTAMQKFLIGVGAFFAGAVMKITQFIQWFKDMPRENPKLWKVVVVIGLGLAGSLVIAATVGLVWFVIINFWSVTKYILLSIAALCLMLVMGVSIYNFLDAWGAVEATEKKLNALDKKISAFLHKHFPKKNKAPRKKLQIKKGFIEFSNVIIQGAIAVKSNTCPKVEIIKEDPS